MFRLAHWLALATEDCTLFQTFSLGVCSARFEPNSYLDPWRLGLEALSLFGLQTGSQTCSGPLGRQKGPQEFTLGCKATTPGLFGTNQPLTSLVEQKKNQLDLCLFHLREKYIFGIILFTCSASIFERPLRGWPRLTDRGTIPVGPVTLGAAQLWRLPDNI